MANVQPEHGARICCLDIEATNLKADFGTVICVSWKWIGEDKVHTVKITDYPSFKTRPWDDKGVVADAAKAIAEADLLVTWYGVRFDVPYLQSRLLYHGLKPLPPVPHWDGWRVARYKMALSSNRLDNVVKFLGLSQKTPLSGEIWVKARTGHRPSIKYVIDHCEADVLALEDAYLKIRCLSNTHPNVNLVDPRKVACPVCGSSRLQKRGWQIARSRKYQRYQCQECGYWPRAVASEKQAPQRVR